MTRVILIISTPRSGSNLLTAAMNLYNPILNLGEFFRDPIYDKSEEVELHQEIQSLLGEKILNFETRNNNAVEILTTFHKKLEKNIVIKIQDYQTKNLDIDKIFNLPFIEIIVLERKNKLNSYISLKQAQATGVFYNFKTDNVKIVFELDKFYEYISSHRFFYNNIKTVLEKRNFLSINYENDLQDFSIEKFYFKLDSWLQERNIDVIKTPDAIIPFTKQLEVSVINCIQNYKENKKIIDNFEKFFKA